MSIANLGRSTAFHRSRPNAGGDEWIDRLAEWLRQWSRLLRDLKYSKQFPRRRLRWSLRLAVVGLVLGFLAVTWNGCCLKETTPPTWAMFVAYTAILSAISSLVIL